MKEMDLRIYDQLVLRSAYYPYSKLTEGRFDQVVGEPAFREALYLASPVLYKELCKAEQGAGLAAREHERIRETVYKYYLRMHSRTTPFGLFAGCSMMHWGDQSEVIVEEEGAHTRTVRLDNQVIGMLSETLVSRYQLWPHLLYQANSSLYAIGDEYRYIERIAGATGQTYEVSSVETTQEISMVLQAAGDPVSALLLSRQIISDLVSPEEALAFVEQMIEMQLLESELQPPLTGADYLMQLVAVMQRLHATVSGLLPQEVIEDLQHILQLLGASEAHANASFKQYEEIEAALRRLLPEQNLPPLFAVNLSPQLVKGSLRRSWQQQLLRVIDVLTYFVKPDELRLRQFKKAFAERHDQRMAPLLQLLDPETGIGYNQIGKSGTTSLTEDFSLNHKQAADQIVVHHGAGKYLYYKIQAANREGRKEIEIREQDLVHFEKAPGVLPATFSAMFRAVSDEEILLEGVGGSSAANLVSRFWQSDAQITKLIKQIGQDEARQSPDVVHAEVLMFPDYKVSNILSRPNLRRYEIPYLAKSNLPVDQQIQLSDIWVGIEADTVFIYSKRLGKRIIPYLSNAHNYQSASLPVYQFLSDLQAQDRVTQLGIAHLMGKFTFKYMPRIKWRSVILSPAQWQFEQQDLAALLAGGQSLAEFVQKWDLPEVFVMANYDRELLVDTRSETSIASWLTALKGQQQIKLKEFLFEPATAVVTDKEGGAYVNQFVAFLKSPGSKHSPIKPHNTHLGEVAVTRTFKLGSEWLYYKLYCGVQSADLVIRELLIPLVAQLREEEIIDRWFFIRFEDPEHHLRLRFHLPDPHRVGEVISKIHLLLQEFEAKSLIWRSQTDTYTREMERYGANTIEACERLFFADSEMATRLIIQAYEHGHERHRWLFCARTIEELLTAFELTVADKALLLGQMRDYMAAEFEVDRHLKKQISQKYREFKEGLEQSITANRQLLNGDGLAAVASIKAVQRDGQLEIDYHRLLASLIHMHVNRLVVTDQRLHELLLYDFMARYYQTQKHIVLNA